MKLTPDLSGIKSIRDEKGQALILVLILLLLAGLIMGPLLAFMSTGLKAGQVHEKKMHEFYAADAGIEDGLWHLQSNERLKELDSDWTPDDVAWSFTYNLTDPGVNRMDVQVTIDPAWILGGLEDPSPDANDHWTVVGALNIDVEPMTNYIVDIITDESTSIRVDHIGVWLPQGYGYDGSVTINGVAIGGDSLVTNPDDSPHRGGTALIWDLPGGTSFQDLSDITPPPPEHGVTPAEKFPPSVRLSFNYTGNEAKGFFPWIKLVDDRIAWDTEAGFYHIQSLATEPGAEEGTTVEVYTPRAVTRYTSGSGGASSAIKGDHIVIGNSLMTCCWNAAKTGPPAEGEECCSSCGCCGTNPYRNYRPVTERFPVEGESWSQVKVSAVPGDAKIERAYLYWTAWLRGDWLWGEHAEEIEEELGDEWVGWQWTQYMGSDAYWEANAPDEVKEWLAENAYDDEAFLEVNGNPIGTDGTVVAGKYYISEGSSNVQPSYQYACFADVTDQITEITTAVGGAKFTVGGVHAHPAESCASSTWNRSSNAGWSMIIIYSSAEKETHQIYLYEGCDHLWDDDREFTVAGFETPLDLGAGETNEAKLTVFASEGDEFGDEYLKFKGQNTGYYDLRDVSDTTAVFNSISSASGFTPSEIKGQPEGGISGIDIDTYTHTRPSVGTPLYEIVHKGDTSAKINVGSSGDGFMLIYVVFSVRSTKVPAGEGFEVGTMNYKVE